MAEVKAFEEKSLNQQDFFDELVVSYSLYWKFLYTGVVSDSLTELFLAKIEIYVILFYCYANLILII